MGLHEKMHSPPSRAAPRRLRRAIAIQAGRLIVDGRSRARRVDLDRRNGRIARIDDGATARRRRTWRILSRTVLPAYRRTRHLTSDPARLWREAVDSNEMAAVIGVKNALLTARAGFTTVRDLGAVGLSSFALRDAIRDGIVPGPRIIASGGALSIVGGHGDVSGFRPEVNAVLDPGGTCTGADQCAQRVREWAKRGSMCDQDHLDGRRLSQQGRGLEGHFDPPRFAPSPARARGFKVAAHAQDARGIEDAALADVDSIDHGSSRRAALRA